MEYAWDLDWQRENRSQEVGRLYLVLSDLYPMYQCKIYAGPVITMNKGGNIFDLGGNGQPVVVPNQVLH